MAVNLRQENAAEQTGGNRSAFNIEQYVNFVFRSCIQPATDGAAPLSAAIDTISNVFLNTKTSITIFFKTLLFYPIFQRAVKFFRDESVLRIHDSKKWSTTSARWGPLMGYMVKSLDFISTVIMKPVVPLNSKASWPTFQVSISLGIILKPEFRDAPK